MTPHNIAKKGEIAKTVLMPGDPLRAKFMAETFLKDSKQVNNVRNMFAYTGTYKQKPVTIMGSGMGCPSMGIYSYELFKFYDVDNIVRIGSCGAFQEDLELYDIILAQGACTNSNYAEQYQLGGVFSAISSFELLEKAYRSAKEKGIKTHVGNILSSDIFYSAIEDYWKPWAKMGVLAVDMEAYALYSNAQYLGKNALTILTVSDSLISKKETSAEEREKNFKDMVEIALELA
ncbi:purine nucleoside phosphorylase [Clostridiales bacterium KA00134]|nr:purine nucleoside phosphorylase [Clostridiales bacterium KA00134]